MAGTLQPPCGAESPLLLFSRARRFARLFLLSFFIDVRSLFWQKQGPHIIFEKGSPACSIFES